MVRWGDRVKTTPGKVIGGIAGAVILVVVLALVFTTPWDGDGDGGGDELRQSTGEPLTFDVAPSQADETVISALPPSKLTQAEINAIVSTHNEWRDKYGVTQRVVWDNDVAAYAQEWAQMIVTSGQFEHRTNAKYGENLFQGGVLDGVSTWTAKGVADSWGKEDADYDRNALTCAEGKVCGHFTQVVWATTTAVGCGKATGKVDGNDAEAWVCNYNPAGNITGFSPFTGQPVAQPETPAPGPPPAETPTNE